MPTTRRQLALVVAAILLGLLGTALVTAPAQADVTLTYTIKNWQDPGKCLDAAVERAQLSTVQVWKCNGKVQQGWAPILLPATPQYSYWEFRNTLFGTCLTKNAPTQRVDVQPCLRDAGFENPNQLWRVYYAYNPASGGGWFQQLQNVGNGLCLDNLGDLSNGAGLYTAPCDPTHESRAQRWKLYSNG